MAFEASRLTRSAVRVTGFKDAEFDYQLLRTAGLSDYGGSTVGECLAAAAMISDGDTSSWVRVFTDLAGRVEAAGNACLEAGHELSARDHLLRASTYYRAAEYYAEADPVSLRESGLRGRRCFELAHSLWDSGVEAVQVPFEGGALPGYLVHPRPTLRDGAPLGVLVVVGGFDSSAEELYFQIGAAGAERGWEVLVFDGPGQNECMRLHPGLTFRPDYEVPVGAVCDFVESRPGSAADRIALAGLSFGGYFAARAAAKDRRIKALVADPPIVDLYKYMEAWLGSPVFESRRDIRPEDVAGIPEDLMLPQMVWGMVAVCRRFGVPSLHSWLAVLDRYRLRESLENVSCPVLAMVGQREGPEVLRQAEEFAAKASGSVSIRRFEIEEGADSHAQVGNLRLFAQVVYDWLALAV